jgi:serine/threonine protein kinase
MINRLIQISKKPPKLPMGQETSDTSSSIDISSFYIQFNDYEKLEDLGKGGFGGVYKAQHIPTGKIVAMKTLRPDIASDEQRIYYNREVYALATLNHPAILPLIGFTPFDEPNGPSIVMPLMTASVQRYINLERNNRAPHEWTPTRKHIILMGIAVGMAFMHSQNWIHRDLKPDNVLLDDSLEPRISDFGLAKFIENGITISQSNQHGTTVYMAPEYFNEERVSTKVDVYAFGMMMFTMLSGLDPFPNAMNRFYLMGRIAKGIRPQIPKTVRAPYVELIKKCWATVPDERPDFKDIMVWFGEERFLEGLVIRVVSEYQNRVYYVDQSVKVSDALIREERQR